MSTVRECEHGLPYGICMDDKCVQKFMSGRMHDFEMGMNPPEAHEPVDYPDADMDTILAHECQHGSDMRVCQKCATMEQVIRTTPPTHMTVEEWLFRIEERLDI